MVQSYRIASFNVENLFERPKVFNVKDKSVGDQVLDRIDAFQSVLKKATYTSSDKTFLVSEFSKGSDPIKTYLRICEDQGKLWKKSGWAIVGVPDSKQAVWQMQV